MPSPQPHHFFQNNQTDIINSPASAGCFSFQTRNPAHPTGNPSSQQQQRTTTSQKPKKPSFFSVHVGTVRHQAGAMGYGQQACAIQ